MKSYKQVIIKPIVSEKAFMLADKGGVKQYTFLVSLNSNKIEIKTAIEEMFGVSVSKVRVMRKTGKSVQWGKKRIKGRRSDDKKAIVTVTKGEIDLFKVS